MKVVRYYMKQIIVFRCSVEMWVMQNNQQQNLKVHCKVTVMLGYYQQLLTVF